MNSRVCGRLLNVGPALLLIVCTVLPAGAQVSGAANADSIALRNDCRLAHQVLVHGGPANKRGWALGIIQNCGTQGADVIAQQLRQARTQALRTAELDSLAHASIMVIDEQIYQAARAVATDRAAGTAARVHALGVWFAQVTGGDILPYEALVSDPAAGGEIVLGPVVSEGPLTLRPLSSDALAASISELEGIVASEANACVRVAARQVLAAFEVLREEG